jgi:SH3 domain-containing protein
MKICAYCTTRNRDEAIFCNHCRRPLRGTPIPRDTSLIRLLAVLFLIGLGSYLVLSRTSLTPASNPPISEGIETPALAPSQAPEVVTLYTCVEDQTRIRRGPSTRSETIGGLVSGTCMTIFGRTADAGWVYMVSDDHQTGWVAASLLRDAGDIGRVSVRDSFALANSARATLTSAEIAHSAEAYLTQIAATNLPGASLSTYMMPCFQHASRIGDYVSCKLEKAYCDYLPDLEGSPTYCSDRPAPDHTFTLTVLGMDWSDYDGKCLIVSGYLEIERGVLQIRALNRDQISSCD